MRDVAVFSEQQSFKICRTKDEFLNAASRSNFYLLSLTLLLSLNWGLSGAFLVIPAFISPTEQLPNNETTIIRIQDEFGTDGWQRPELVATAFSMGNFVLGPLLSGLADSFGLGRKPVIIWSILATGMFGVGCALSPNFEALLIFRFLQGIFYNPATLTNWVHVTESTPKASHAAASVIFGISWITGCSICSPVAYYITSWRHILFFLSMPNIILALFLRWWLQESFEFMLMNNHYKNAENFAQRVLHREKKAYEYKLSDMIHRAIMEKTTADKPTFVRLLRLLSSSRKLSISLAISCYMCFASTFLHNAMALTSTVIKVGNVYWNFFFSAVVELPSYLVVPILFQIFGRTWTLFLFHSLTVAANCGIIIFQLESSTAFLWLWLLAKFACSSAFMCFFIIAAQQFPCEFRGLCIAFCTTVGALGAVVAPLGSFMFTIEETYDFQILRVIARDPEEADRNGRVVNRTSDGRPAAQGVKINKQKYIKNILEGALLPWTCMNFADRPFCFQDDSTAAHMEIVTQEWCVNSLPASITSKQWPTSSPYLNRPLD